MGKLSIGSKHLSKAIKNDIPILEKQVEIKEIEKFIHIIKEVPIEVEKIIETIKEIPIDVIRYVEVPIEKEVIKYIEVIKEIPIEIHKEIEVIKEIEKIIEKNIKIVPKWVWGIMSIQTIVIILLLIK